MTNVCSTALPTVIEHYKPSPFSGHASHTLLIHQILTDMRRRGRRFCRVKLLTMGYTACNVNRSLELLLYIVLCDYSIYNTANT